MNKNCNSDLLVSQKESILKFQEGNVKHILISGVIIIIMPVYLGCKIYNNELFSIETKASIDTLLTEISKYTLTKIDQIDEENDFDKTIKNMNLQSQFKIFKNPNHKIIEIPEREQEMINVYKKLENQQEKDLVLVYTLKYAKYYFNQVIMIDHSLIDHIFTFSYLLFNQFVKNKSNFYEVFERDHFEFQSYVELGYLNYIVKDLADIFYMMWNLKINKSLSCYFIQEFITKVYNEVNIESILHLNALDELMRDDNEFIII